MGDDIIQQILVTLARIEERIKAQAEQADHRHNNLKMVVEGFVPRPELAEKFRAIDDRLAKIESNQSKAGWAIVSAWIAGLGTVGTLLAKKF